MNIEQLSTYVRFINFDLPPFLEIQMFKAFFYKKPIVSFESAEPYEYPSFDRQITVEQINDIFKITERIEYVNSTEEKIETVPVDKYSTMFDKIKNYLFSINAQRFSDRIIAYLINKKGELPSNIDILFQNIVLLSKDYGIDNIKEENIEKTFDILKKFPPIDVLPKLLQIRLELNNPYSTLLPITVSNTDKIVRYEHPLHLTVFVFADVKYGKYSTQHIVLDSKMPLNNIKFNHEIQMITVSLDNKLLHNAWLVSDNQVQRLNFVYGKKNDGTFINKIGLGKYAILPKDVAEKTKKYRYKPEHTLHYDAEKQFSLFIDTNKLIEKQTVYIIPEEAILNLRNITLSCYLNINNATA